MTKTVVSALILIAVLVAGLYVGKFYADAIPPWDSESADPTSTTEDVSIIAQGRIEPFGGIFSVYAPQGQRVTRYVNDQGEPIRVGKQVRKNETVARVAAQELLDKQLELANARAEDAQQELAVAVTTATLQVRAAELAQKEANFKLKQVQSNKDQSINQKKLDNAKAKLDRLQALAEDPDTKNLVSQQTLMDQQIEWENAKLELKKAKEQILQAEEAALFAVAKANENLADAKKALEDAKNLKADPPKSLAAAQALAQTQSEISKLVSPIDGVVLKLFVKEGEAVVNTPLMQIGNLNKMQCVAEVSDRMVGKIGMNDRVKIKSPVFGDQVLGGKVIRIDGMVGDSTLAMANPLAMVDKKTVDVTIAIDGSDARLAKNFVNLQVDVEIEFQK